MRLLLAQIVLTLCLVLPIQCAQLERTSTESLRQVLLIHRHGDRTPIVFPSRDPLKNHPFWREVGLSSLTNEGKSRLNTLGHFIRDRYENFLTIDRHEVNTRSSGAERCQESALLFLSGLYKPDERAHQVWDIANPLAKLWLPMQEQNVPIQYDGMLAEAAICNRLNKEYELINKTEQVKSIYKRYNHVAKVLNEEIGQEFPNFFYWFYASSLIDIERQYFPDRISPRIMELYEPIVAAGEEAMAAYISTNTSIRLRAGLLVNDMLKHMQDYERGKTKIKLHHYSSHDLNIIGLLGALDLFGKYPKRPGYGASFIMELHVDDTISMGRKFVKFFYLPDTDGDLFEIKVPKCSDRSEDGRCYLDELVQAMVPFTIPSWNQWWNECDSNEPINLY